MPWECSRCPREGGAGVDPAENVGCECAGAPGPGVLGQVGSLLLAGDGWTGRCFGAWLLHGRWKLCFVFLDDVRNVTRLVCFPSLTEPASHLVDQPAGHLQGVCKMDTHQRESCWRVGQGWVGLLRREQGKPPGCKTAGEPVGGARCPPEDFGAIHAFTECPLQENMVLSLPFPGSKQRWDLRSYAGIRTTKYLPCALPISRSSPALAAPTLTSPGGGLVPRALRRAARLVLPQWPPPHLAPQPLALFSEAAVLPLCLFFCLCFSSCSWFIH